MAVLPVPTERFYISWTIRDVNRIDDLVRRKEFQNGAYMRGTGLWAADETCELRVVAE
jgi:hypothetical protein